MRFKREEWPNGLGFDHVYPDGSEWSHMQHPGGNWSAGYFPPGERSPTLGGSGNSAEEARANAKPIER
jgi:hypothetical protein